MEKQIKDYLHLYIGCECKAENIWKDKLTGIYPSQIEIGKLIMLVGDQEFYIEHIKPILRPLSDMTEEEKKELALMVDPKLKKYEINFLIMDALQTKTWGDGMSHVMYNYSPEMVVFLLSRSFDLFGLIDAELALDKTKL